MIIVPKYFQSSWNVLCVAIIKLGYHGKTTIGSPRYYCSECRETFPVECCANTNTFDTLYYRRKIQPEQMRMLLQTHVEGSSLKGISGKRESG
ncbi:MAG: hypothetical protein F6K25_02825 [Okeania sp. SIO2G4]|uniref:hypothetical protein n=1 Tax=unclassified Okeania TaxID=2634635 RepID=UPI0013BDBB81|nr:MULTISPECIES: hypothetical protein [unclassified Okeania]NEP04721.1 hypothetical protein [Okeania sp. SIO4D6]NEP71429.1 hypothetical protein [Okeania sp. SIO2G5]NEP96079.1 hypothetical protein [Okeania sp. SIO2F5]NEQ89732.1 hypothetical protein [Okeania sp. SIO2G4]